MTTTTMNFQIENLKAEIESTKKIQLADAVEEFDAKLAADRNLDDLTVAARHIARCLNLIADYESRIDTLKAKISAGENPEIKKFEVGGVYSLDGGFADRFKVVAVNGSFVTVINAYGNKIRRKVRVIYNAETIVPYTDRKQYGLRAGYVLSAKSFIKKITLDDEANAALIACIDDYTVDVDAAAEVEEVNAENAKAAEENAEVKKFEVGKWYYDCCISANKSPAYKVTHRTKKMVTLTDDFGEIIKRKIDATSSVEKVSFNGDIMPIFLQADCFCTNAEEIQKAEDALAYSLAADNGNITVEETDSNAEIIACIDDYFVNSDDAAEVEEVNAKNAKAAEKVAILQNLKTNKGGRIEMLPADVENTIWNVIGYHTKNEVRSKNAGYDILENEDGDWVSLLGDRVEINLASGETFNLWIVEKTLYYARQHNLVECGFILDMAAEKEDAKGVKFWLGVIEYKLKNREDAEIWREILKTEYYLAMLANLELIACIDDYATDAYAAAEVEIENAKNAAAEVEELNARNAVFEISKKRDAFIANVFANCGKFSIKLARSDEDRNFHLDEDGLWTVRLTEKDVGYLNELYYYEEGGKFTLALMRGLSDYNVAEYDTEEEVRKAIISLGAAVKRGEKIFTFPAARKPIIDWDAVYNDFRIEEIFNLQRDFKKFLKLGEMKRAENVFENLKDVFQKYQRRKAA